MTMEKLLIDYPDPEPEDFLSCLKNADKLVQIKTIHKKAS